MDVLDRMTAEEYHANFPRTCNKTVRIQASPNSAFQTTPYGLRLLAEEGKG
ncbi:Protein CBG07520 [Caenorhabditis briggsae]|uniref:Protein CBG07520 n=1 Tax=Caenorhabditis briggsae TaxID=6238 RepID=A8X4M6_CAEBR|nr:Protein CBG07520 [Caenorhabditis briggsae]CAP27586.1 Protein CBG07520 [Caenorhabditis briggsae]